VRIDVFFSDQAGITVQRPNLINSNFDSAPTGQKETIRSPALFFVVVESAQGLHVPSRIPASHPIHYATLNQSRNALARHRSVITAHLWNHCLLATAT
jgi:hypothetical protein